MVHQALSSTYVNLYTEPKHAESHMKMINLYVDLMA